MPGGSSGFFIGAGIGADGGGERDGRRDDLVPEFADVGRLARRGLQAVLRAARAGGEGFSWSGLIRDHMTATGQRPVAAPTGSWEWWATSTAISDCRT